MLSDSVPVTEAPEVREAPSPLETPAGAVVSVPGASKRERDHDYRAVIVDLDAKCRVIDCKDSIQWIIQRLRGDQWHGVSFHRNRDVLIERSGAAEALNALRLCRRCTHE
jgi:hypothetical protein